MVAILATLDHAPTRRAVTAERALLAALEEAVSADRAAMIDGDRSVLHGIIASIDGTRVVRGSMR
jgi:hydroxymethylbilane synthase